MKITMSTTIAFVLAEHWPSASFVARSLGCSALHTYVERTTSETSRLAGKYGSSSANRHSTAEHICSECIFYVKMVSSETHGFRIDGYF